MGSDLQLKMPLPHKGSAVIRSKGSHTFSAQVWMFLWHVHYMHANTSCFISLCRLCDSRRSDRILWPINAEIKRVHILFSRDCIRTLKARMITNSPVVSMMWNVHVYFITSVRNTSSSVHQNTSDERLITRPKRLRPRRPCVWSCPPAHFSPAGRVPLWTLALLSFV